MSLSCKLWHVLLKNELLCSELVLLEEWQMMYHLPVKCGGSSYSKLSECARTYSAGHIPTLSPRLENGRSVLIPLYTRIITPPSFSLPAACRYSEFHSLHQALKCSFPDTKLTPMPKKIYFGRSQTRTVAKQRMKELESYLQVCFSYCCSCMLLFLFL